MTAINTTSLASSLTGTTFDWQAFVDTIIEYDTAPIYKLQNEQTLNTDKVSALATMKTNLLALQTATKALSTSGLFTGRTVSSSTTGSNWALTASSGATTGAYTFNVAQLATASKRSGAADIGAALSNSDDVSGLTLAALPTNTAIKAGTFTINGATVTLALTDSLQDAFDKISAATGGAVTASYSSATDKISLTSGSEIVLGGANDTSNFLAATQLANNGSGSVSSANSLGTINATATLANARLKNAITTPTGSFSINGVAIAYDINTDSLNDVISRINASSAGVTASYSKESDRLVLTNNTTGDMGFGLSEAAGGFLDAFGLSMTSAGASTTRGKNALFSINGGSTLTSASNTFTSDVTGLTGLTVKANTEGSQTITVASDTTSMKTAIQNFIDKYNAVQTYLDLQTSITVKSGTVTTSTLSSNREVGEWGGNLRAKVFGSVSGLSGTLSRLSDLGIDFNGVSSMLTIRDSSKLDSALANKPSDVEAFFNTASTGFASRMDAYITSISGTDGTSTGAISKMTDSLLKSNLSIDKQIEQIQRRLDAEKQRLTAGFQAMQAAQSNAKSMITTLKNAFDSKTSS